MNSSENEIKIGKMYVSESAHIFLYPDPVTLLAIKVPGYQDVDNYWKGVAVRRAKNYSDAVNRKILLIFSGMSFLVLDFEVFTIEEDGDEFVFKCYEVLLGSNRGWIHNQYWFELEELCQENI